MIVQLPEIPNKGTAANMQTKQNTYWITKVVIRPILFIMKAVIMKTEIEICSMFWLFW